MTHKRTLLEHFALPSFGRPFMQCYDNGCPSAGVLRQLALKVLASDTKRASQSPSSEFAQSLFAAVDVALALQDAEAAVGVIVRRWRTSVAKCGYGVFIQNDVRGT